jgi:hypothetical protein
LQLAGDWLYDAGSRPKHLMRVMLVSNIDVKARFANGTLGRLLCWQPGSVEKGKALLANHPQLSVRFVKESALQKREFVTEVDTMEIPARPENLTGPGAGTAMVQVPVLPADALTTHKVQSLTISHSVRACLEGVFAHGTLYVDASRCDDPANFSLIGLPPEDLLDDVARRWLAMGLDVNECFAAACTVTREWEYTPPTDGRSAVAAVGVRSRLKQRRVAERRVPVKLRTLEEIVNPQPQMSAVNERFLEWVQRENDAWLSRLPPPAFETHTGEAIFPDPNEVEWWLTDVQQRKSEEARATEAQQVIEDGPPSEDDEAQNVVGAEVPDEQSSADQCDSDSEGDVTDDDIGHGEVTYGEDFLRDALLCAQNEHQAFGHSKHARDIRINDRRAHSKTERTPMHGIILRALTALCSYAWCVRVFVT